MQADVNDLLDRGLGRLGLGQFGLSPLKQVIPLGPGSTKEPRSFCFGNEYICTPKGWYLPSSISINANRCCATIESSKAQLGQHRKNR